MTNLKDELVAIIREIEYCDDVNCPKCNELAQSLCEYLEKEEYVKKSEIKDNIFIEHIQSHLKPNQEVICKICGKTAREITGQIIMPSKAGS